jgi:hypothetical protein
MITFYGASWPAVRAAFASSAELTVPNDATALCRSGDGQAATQRIFQPVHDLRLEVVQVHRVQETPVPPGERLVRTRREPVNELLVLAGGGLTLRRLPEFLRFCHRPNSSAEWSMLYEYLSADRGLWILVGLREQLSRGT